MHFPSSPNLVQMSHEFSAPVPQDKVILQQQLGQQLSSLQKLNQQLSAAVPWQMELNGEWLLMVNNG